MSIDFRKDVRSLEEFKKDIKQRTRKERFLVNIFADIMISKGHTVKVIDNGVDNQGRLVKKSNCRPDFRIIIDGMEELYEVKNSFTDWKWTFKVYQLKEYIKYGANILIFWNTDKIDGNHKKLNKEKARWGVIRPDKIKLMLNEHKPYNEPKFGDKLCIQVLKKEFSRYVVEHSII